jgi:uncharacterized protein YllA (UPF0747 family)
MLRKMAANIPAREYVDGQQVLGGFLMRKAHPQQIYARAGERQHEERKSAAKREGTQ